MFWKSKGNAAQKAYGTSFARMKYKTFAEIMYCSNQSK